MNTSRLTRYVTRPIVVVSMATASVVFSGSTVPASTVGSLSNFDAVNDTGAETVGFEIELEGVHSSDVYGTFGAPYNRYGDPIREDTPTGVIIRWTAKWDPVNLVFDTATPAALPNINPGGHDCYNGGPIGNYLTSGCEHFGVSLRNAQSATGYRWLVADPNQPGHLTGGSSVHIPAPTFSVVLNPMAGNPVAIQAVLEAPREDSEHREYADAYWAKLIKTEIHAPENLHLEDLLLGGGPGANNMGLFDIEDEDQETEIEWVIVQNRLNGNPGENELAQEMKAGGNDKAVAFRFEFFEYTGQYDPENHEVMCGGDGGCDRPLDSELGQYLGAQMAGINLNPDVPLPGDFDQNGSLDIGDIDLLTQQVQSQGNDAAFDLNADGVVDEADRTVWVKDLMNTWIGDTNLDLEFNSNDLIDTFQQGEYEDPLIGNSSWASGDWDGDGDFTSSDLVAAFADGGYEFGPRAAAALAVPEPTSAACVLFALVILAFEQRNRLQHRLDTRNILGQLRSRCTIVPSRYERRWLQTEWAPKSAQQR